jgi:hypothetical protein
MSDRDQTTTKLLIALEKEAYDHQDAVGKAGLAIEERVFLACCHASGEVDNGGFEWFYHGPANPTEVIESFERIGMRNIADAVRKSLQVFPNGVPQSNRERRCDWIERRRLQIEAHWEPLNRLLWDAGGEIQRRLVEWAKSNKAFASYAAIRERKVDQE